MSPRPGWFERVQKDVIEKTRDRPEWRRSIRVNEDLRRLQSVETTTREAPETKPPGHD
jgi:hypothetical protein